MATVTRRGQGRMMVVAWATDPLYASQRRLTNIQAERNIIPSGFQDRSLPLLNLSSQAVIDLVIKGFSG